MTAHLPPGALVDLPDVGVDERVALDSFLRRQRELVAWKLADCPADVLQSAVTPSGMTALGVVQHLTEVERSWFRDRLAGEDGLTFASTDADPDGEFRVGVGTTTDAVLAAYADEWARCDEAVAGFPLDQTGVRTRFTLRWVLHHMTEETARHLGHLDLLREQADGSTGEEPA